MELVEWWDKKNSTSVDSISTVVWPLPNYIKPQRFMAK